ncbi:MAG: hypothetical protein Kow00127_17090 [Bacteroidales bacterium]
MKNYPDAAYIGKINNPFKIKTMKTRMMSLLVLYLLGITVVFAQNKIEKFKVYGNCGMCENRIEKAVKALDGVVSADWDQKTKMIEVEFDTSVVSRDQVEKAIAAVGHDTDKYKAEDQVYNELPSCCHYDRPERK